MFQAATNRAQRVIRQIDLAESLGLDRRDLLSRVHLSESDLVDPDSRVPVLKAVRLLQIIADLSENPDIGLELGQRLQIREAGVVGYAMAYSEDLESALQRLVRFRKILDQRAEADFRRTGKRWRLTIKTEPLMEGFRPAIDDVTTAIVVGMGQLIGRRIEPARVGFTYPKPQDTSRHRAIFGSGIRFGTDYQVLEFWHRDIQTSIPDADPRLTAYLDELAEIRLGSLPENTSLASRVRQAIWPHLSEGQPTIDTVASDLALSSRTLQRRLREEGTSYGQVVESLRKEKASLLLSDRNLAVYEVGYLLGYSDPSAFHRAFRRWHGRSPSQYRQLTS